MSIAQKIFTLIFMAAVLNSCYTDNPAESTGYGSLTGVVKVYDDRGFPLEDFGDVQVKVSGTDIMTYTNPDGTWLIEKMPVGTYDFEFSKEGFDKGRIFGYRFRGGQHIDIGIRISMMEPPKTKVTSLFAIANKSLNSAVIKAYMTDKSGYLIFFNDNENVDKEYGNYKFVKFEDSRPGDVNGDVKIDLDELKPFFGSGETVYIVIYPVNPSFTTYEDGNSGKVFYAGLGKPSQVISFTMP